MVERLPLALLLEMSEPSHAGPRSASSDTFTLDLVRQAGVCRLESVEAACAGLLIILVVRMWQDKSVRLRTCQCSIATRLVPKECLVAGRGLGFLPAPSSAARTGVACFSVSGCFL